MTDTEFVDALNNFWLNIGSAETADDTDIQDRSTFEAQRAVSRFWHRYHWPIKQRSDTVMISDGQGDLPDDFATFGTQGLVAVYATGSKLRWIPAHQMVALQAANNAEPGATPTLFTVTGIASMAVGTPLLKTFPAATTTLVCYYEAKAPTITYGGMDSGLDQIPVQWHETVLFPLACSFLAFAEGDPRAPQLEAQAMQAMAEAWAEENPSQGTPRRRGPAYGRAYARG